MKTITIVEDEKMIREELSLMLKREGYKVKEISDFKDMTEQILTFSTDLVLLDLNLPNESGFQICRELKNKSSIPVMILTSREQLKDELFALKLGADEYMTKPFRKERLIARIANVLKRYEGREHLLERDNFLLDQNTYTIYIDGKSTVLPQNQGKLLETFLSAGSKSVSKEKLSKSLWGTTEYIDENALQVNITRLKKTMHELGMMHQIESVRGKGYKLIYKGNIHET